MGYEGRKYVDGKDIVRDIEDNLNCEKLRNIMDINITSLEDVYDDYKKQYRKKISGVKNRIKKVFSSKKKNDFELYVSDLDEFIENCVNVVLRGLGRLSYKNNGNGSIRKILDGGIRRLDTLSKSLGEFRKKVNSSAKKKAFDVGKLVKRVSDKSVSFGKEDYDYIKFKNNLLKMFEGLEKEVSKNRNEIEKIIKNLEDTYEIEPVEDSKDKEEVTVFKKLAYFKKLVYTDLESLKLRLESLINSPRDGRALILLKEDLKKYSEEEKKTFNEYKKELEEFLKFVELLKECHVFDTNMGATMGSTKGKITKSKDYEQYYSKGVDIAPTCLQIAQAGKFEKQYDHSKGDRFFGKWGPYYMVIDSSGKEVEGAKAENNATNSVNRSYGEDKAVEEVIKVMKDSLKAGKWVPIK